MLPKIHYFMSFHLYKWYWKKLQNLRRQRSFSFYFYLEKCWYEKILEKSCKIYLKNMFWRDFCYILLFHLKKVCGKKAALIYVIQVGGHRLVDGQPEAVEARKFVGKVQNSHMMTLSRLGQRTRKVMGPNDSGCKFESGQHLLTLWIKQLHLLQCNRKDFGFL